jgi:hypothetical protein
MKNPFESGDAVIGNAFCNREKEVADLLRGIESNEKLSQPLSPFCNSENEKTCDLSQTKV